MGFDTWKGKSSLLFFKFYLATFDLLFIYMGFNFVFFFNYMKILIGIWMELCWIYRFIWVRLLSFWTLKIFFFEHLKIFNEVYTSIWITFYFLNNIL